MSYGAKRGSVLDNWAMTSSISPQKGSKSGRPPGPGHYLWLKTIAGLRDPLNFNLTHWKKHGDCIRFDATPGLGWYLFVHPTAVEYILQTNQQNFQKPLRFLKPFGYVGGRGLLTNEGEDWRKQRRLLQPSFHRERLTALGAAMQSSICEQVELWEKMPENKQVDLFSEMSRLTFRVIGKTLFSDDLTDNAERFFIALENCVEHISSCMNGPVLIPTWIPSPANQKFLQNKKVLDDVVFSIIENRKTSTSEHNDLLDMLMKSTFDDDSQRMNPRQLHDEILTLLISGHETVSLALTWTFILLHQNRSVEDTLLDEYKSVLAGRIAAMEDLPRLPYTKMVLNESLRLYPPIWGQPREALEDDEVSGFHVEKGMPVTVSQYVTHRHPEFFPEPDKFLPERFLPENEAKLPKFAYFPFGGGMRSCIGNNFALAEGQMAIANILQRLKIELVDEMPILPRAGCTLRPGRIVWAQFKKR